MLETATGRFTLAPAPAIHLIGLSRNTRIHVLNEAVCVYEVDVPSLVKLVAFLDFSMSGNAPVTPPSIRRTANAFCVDGFSAPEGDLIQREFIGRLVDDDRRDAPLFNFLRATEAYWVVSFLLQQFAENKRVSDLGAQYGLSNAHFRRLCKQALGGSLKAELKRWRAASAVLRIIESEQTLTDIALDAGFASSSHLSREIKGLIGVPPSQIWGFGVGKRWTTTRDLTAAARRERASRQEPLSPGYTHHLCPGGMR
ncbi:MAG TPA: helix-turn-helix domain-containing protein [Pararobbsia sp.]|nr:helix-turn-helix domain-containing protein [Pararobbsia sp.]